MKTNCRNLTRILAMVALGFATQSDRAESTRPREENQSEDYVEITRWVNEAEHNPDLAKDVVAFERWRQKIFLLIQKSRDRESDKDTVAVLFRNAAEEDYSRKEPTPARSIARGLGYLEGLALAEKTKHAGNAPSIRAQVEQFVEQGEKDNALRTDVPFQRWRTKVRAYLENTGFRSVSVEFSNATWDFLYDKADELMKLKQWLGRGLGVLDSFKETIGEVRTSSPPTTAAKLAGPITASPASSPNLETRYKRTSHVTSGLILDAPGSVLHIAINPKYKKTTLLGLEFTEPCTVRIESDTTVTVDKEGLIVKDTDGKYWKSTRVTVNASQVNCFFSLDLAGTIEPPATGAPSHPHYRAKAATDQTSPMQSKVITLGAAAGDAANPSFEKPPDNWPPYFGELQGSMEVRIRNPNDFKVRVGLRSEQKGRDFEVSANGVSSAYVPNGRYDIYLQYSSDPEGLYQGDSFTLSNNGVEIQIVKVVNGNYGIRKVK